MDSGCWFLNRVWWLCFLLSYRQLRRFIFKKVRHNNTFSNETSQASISCRFSRLQEVFRGTQARTERAHRLHANTHSENRTDQPVTKPGSRLNHSKAITTKITKVTISWYLQKNPAYFLNIWGKWAVVKLIWIGHGCCGTSTLKCSFLGNTSALRKGPLYFLAFLPSKFY